MHESLRPTQRVRRQTIRSARSGFTLVEAVLVVIIIAVLAAILLVAIRAALLGARSKGEGQMLTNMQIQISHFKSTYGFVPPLVRDDAPGPVSGADEVLVRSPDFLRDASQPGLRYSEFTLPIYLLGALPSDVDGIDGFGLTKPLPPVERTTGVWVGPFSKRGAKIEALADVTRDRNRIRRDSDTQVRLLDRWNRPLRYYRWDNAYFASGAREGEVERWGIPEDLWPVDVRNGAGTRDEKAAATAARLPELRSASYAILSLGADGVVSKDDLVEYER